MKRPVVSWLAAGVAAVGVGGIASCTGSRHSAVQTPYVAHAVSRDTAGPPSRGVPHHDRVAAALGLLPLHAVELPEGWREVRISERPSEIVSAEWLLRVVWGPEGAHGQLIRWWAMALDSAWAASERRSRGGPSPLAVGCGPVREGNGVRACVLPVGTPESWRAVADSLERAAWAPRVATRRRLTTGSPSAIRPTEVNVPGQEPTRIVTFVDTVWIVDHVPELHVERLDGRRYQLDSYRAESSSQGEYDEWKQRIGEIRRLLELRRR